MGEFVVEAAIDEAVLPSAPGEAGHLALALANSAVALPGGHTADLLGTPAQAEQWLARRGLAPVGAGLAEVCATRLRSLREQVRSLLASRVADQPALPAAVTAINGAMTRVPTASLLLWGEQTGPYRATPHPTAAIVEHALAVIAADAADLLTSPDATRLTACASPPCNRFLLKHGRRQWCSTRCGDRARAACAYARRTAME
ncbi:CGNR zinc finger domain-containing protein [Streptomyces sp. NPDC006551]|uniref:CGNR zinc finger domain-containing protein n=1 Tax=Streptomyces sp. NPDC006551 TaxID=3157178 RepID=UPI0033A8A629